VEKQTTSERYKALLQLGYHIEGLSDEEEVGGLMAIAYPEIEVHTFVNTFLTSVDTDRFDSDTGHVDCPVACIKAVLAYQRAGGQLLSRR